MEASGNFTNNSTFAHFFEVDFSWEPTFWLLGETLNSQRWPIEAWIPMRLMAMALRRAACKEGSSTCGGCLILQPRRSLILNIITPQDTRQQTWHLLKFYISYVICNPAIHHLNPCGITRHHLDPANKFSRPFAQHENRKNTGSTGNAYKFLQVEKKSNDVSWTTWGSMVDCWSCPTRNDGWDRCFRAFHGDYIITR